MGFINEAKKIWLVLSEDFPEVIIEPWLRSKGFEVNQGAITFESEILAQLYAFGPDLVLLEAGKGTGDVFELCRHIKGDSLLRGVPVIIFGTENNMVQAAKAYRAGAGYYVGLAGGDCFALLDLIERILAKSKNFPIKGQN